MAVECFNSFLAIKPFITNKNSSFCRRFTNLKFTINYCLDFYSLVSEMSFHSSKRNLRV